MKGKFVTVLSASVLAIILSLAGCGSFNESHNYNAPVPYKNYVLKWVRLETPGLYHTVIFACHYKDGIYTNQADNNSVTVVPNDPNCVTTIATTKQG